MNKYKFSKRAMSLIASAMTLGISFNSMANPNSKSTLVQSDEHKTDYKSFTLEDYEIAKKKGLLVYRLLDDSIVGWGMRPIMSADSKQYKCDGSVEIPLHPVVQRSQAEWWLKKNRNIQYFYLPSINNPDESYLIRCDYDENDPAYIECFYAGCSVSGCRTTPAKSVFWNMVARDSHDRPQNPENTGSLMYKFPTKVLESYLPKADNNVINEIKQMGFAGYNDKSSACKYVLEGGLIAMLPLYLLLLNN